MSLASKGSSVGYDIMIIDFTIYSMKLDSIRWSIGVINFQNAEHTVFHKAACGKDFRDMFTLHPVKPAFVNIPVDFYGKVVNDHMIESERETERERGFIFWVRSYSISR